MKLRPKPEQSRKYLETLSTKQNFLFTAFDDDQDRNKPSHAFYGTLDEHYPQLTALNNQGYGIFVCVNETAGISRKKADIVNIRAVWIESDSGEQFDTPIQPNLVVESSPGKFHKYFLVTGMTAFQQVALQELLVRDFHSDPNATDLSRVLRLPGFYHQKKSERKGLIGQPHLVRILGDAQ